jgi:hypothetical protein
MSATLFRFADSALIQQYCFTAPVRAGRNCRHSPELRKQIERSDGNEGHADDESHPKRFSAAQFATESALFAHIGFSNLGHSYLHAFFAFTRFAFKTMRGLSYGSGICYATAKAKLGPTGVDTAQKSGLSAVGTG